ncbi:MAG: 2-oxoglutarate and iron-dependent oxygenase domain-containing protein [Woeseiaceae bacterium]|nr:2-oxoglutarate and iron-dependent oxygenase domain-containing protein [Woeseiaceae bacterium]
MTRPAENSVPVVDISELDGDAAHRSIDAACRDWGFFQITGHGIGDTVVTDLFDAASRFFAQPVETKREIMRSAENPWGYYDEELTKNTRDWKQVFDFGPEDGDTQVARWPELLGFEPAVRAYYDACESLAHRLLAVISTNLGMPSDHLGRDFGDGHTSFLRLNYYPLHPDGNEETPFGVNQHSDAGALTLLLQDDQPGLEVHRDGEWHLVEPTPGALVINIGDMVQVWSNDEYRAALHRVVTNPVRDRFSAPYFFNPAWDTDYAPLPTRVSPERPALYRPINWREFRTLRHAGDYADYGDEVQISDYRY